MSTTVSKEIDSDGLATYTWKLNGFSTLDCEKEIDSPQFQHEGFGWRLECYPGGHKDGKGTHVSLFLRCLDVKTPKREVEYDLIVVDPSGKDHAKIKCGPDTFSGVSVGIYKFHELEDLKTKYLDNDQLTLQVRLHGNERLAMDSLLNKLAIPRPASLIMTYKDEPPLYLDAYVMALESELVEGVVMSLESEPIVQEGLQTTDRTVKSEEENGCIYDPRSSTLPTTTSSPSSTQATRRCSLSASPRTTPSRPLARRSRR